jgi:hypothetical protein
VGENLKINWRYALGELVLIVLGILIAFWINDYGKAREDRKLEKQYIKALQAELQGDTTFYDSIFQKNTKRIEAAYRVMAILEKQTPFPQDTFAFFEDILATMAMDDGIRFANVWHELQTTGNLRLLQNRKLVDALFDYYSQRASNEDNTHQYYEPVICANRELVDEVFPLKTFQEISQRHSKTLPDRAVFTTFFNHPDVRKKWKKLIVRATLLNAKLKLFHDRATDLLQLLIVEKS